MEIRLNGESYACAAPFTAADLLASLGVRSGTVVVEINRRVVPRERLQEETLGEGDAVEVIRLVGGG